MIALLCTNTKAVAAPPETENPYRLIDQFGEAMAVVERDYVEAVSRREMLDGALRGMMSGLDPHSTYFNREDLEIFHGDTTGRFGGIGVEVDFEGSKIVIIAPIEGSPAARAGIVPGDQILAIDGRPVHGRDPAELVRVMRGEIGSKVRLTIRKTTDDKVVDMVLVREQISVSSVLAVPLEDGIGYLRIKNFKEGTVHELLEGIAELRKQLPHLQGIILDLRNNPGGLVHEAKGVANQFLSGGVIYTTRHRGEILETERARPGGAWTKGPLVVLVNEYSASASELLSGALRDHGRAIVVGANTFGKGSVQTVVPISSGGALKLTTALYYSPRGRTIQANGVTPHLTVDPGYIEGPSYRVLKERDLPGHIGERPEQNSEPRGAPPTTDQLHLGVARQVPADPSQGPDRALAVAFHVVRGRSGPQTRSKASSSKLPARPSDASSRESFQRPVTEQPGDGAPRPADAEWKGPAPERPD